MKEDWVSYPAGSRRSLRTEHFERWIKQKSQQEFEKGDKSQILFLLHECLLHRWSIPDWLQEAFDTAYNKVNKFQVKSWDDAFGRPLKKGDHLARAKRDLEIECELFLAVRTLHEEQGRSIDKGLFEEVGAEFDIGGTTASEIFYRFCKENPYLAAGYPLRRSGLPKK